MSTAREKTLVVLGANEDQAQAYREARQLGYKTVGFDQNPQAFAAPLADRFIAASTRDVQRIIHELGDTAVAGIVAPASDASQLTLYHLSQYYRTSFQPAQETITASTDKGHFLEVLRELGLPGYKFRQSADLAYLASEAAKMRFPLIVKPSDSSGSKGIRLVQEADGLGVLNEALVYAQRFSFSKNVIVEEFLTGQHYSVEVFLHEGKLGFAAISQRLLTPLPYLITLAHLIPAPDSAQLLPRLQPALEAVCAKVGLRNGPANFDFVLTEAENEIYLIEMNARLAGNGLPQLVEAATGVNTFRATVQLALGQAYDLTPRADLKVLLYILHSPEDGLLQQIHGLEEVQANPAVRRLELFVKPGEQVRAFTESARKLGYLMLVGNTQAEVDQTLAEVRATLRFELAEVTRPVETTSAAGN